MSDILPVFIFTTHFREDPPSRENTESNEAPLQVYKTAQAEYVPPSKSNSQTAQVDDVSIVASTLAESNSEEDPTWRPKKEPMYRRFFTSSQYQNIMSSFVDSGMMAYAQGLACAAFRGGRTRAAARLPRATARGSRTPATAPNSRTSAAVRGGGTRAAASAAARGSRTCAATQRGRTCAASSRTQRAKGKRCATAKEEHGPAKRFK
ncbi:unnamed protein product [Cylicocyclus nassatus]|uniref:Uncharacterized protein n=1 Tax=Cylicocyclus nassatus TaxID=53992 RepID=A0AA36HGN1_CYLNA|nr:unnamed protein product [Cylicocyclus nassatus]